MADLRTSFPSLENFSTGAGEALTRVNDGDAMAGRNAAPGLVAIDDGNLLRYLRLNSANELLVSSAGSFVGLSDYGTHAGSTSNQTVAELVLQNDYVYRDLTFLGACFRNAIFEVVQIDDSAGTPVETIHTAFDVGPGQLTVSERLATLEFTAGSTGVCVLRLRAKNLIALDVSDFRGNLTMQEIQP